MKLLTTLNLAVRYSRKAVIYSPLAILAVISAEALQHIIEVSLNMYDSRRAFIENQNNRLRLGFGILKALSVVFAAYWVPKTLSQKLGPAPRYGSFNRDFMRKMWNPKGDFHGMLAMIIAAIPLVYLHTKLSTFAMGHPHAIFLLIIDSFLIGALALIMGTVIWASDAVTAGGY